MLDAPRDEKKVKHLSPLLPEEHSFYHLFSPPVIALFFLLLWTGGGRGEKEWRLKPERQAESLVRVAQEGFNLRDQLPAHFLLCYRWQ